MVPGGAEGARSQGGTDWSVGYNLSGGRLSSSSSSSKHPTGSRVEAGSHTFSDIGWTKMDIAACSGSIAGIAIGSGSVADISVVSSSAVGSGSFPVVGVCSVAVNVDFS